MHSSRKAPRRGRHLPSLEWEALLELDPFMARQDERLRAEGYVRARGIRVYLRTDGRLTLTLVWRRREAGVTTTFTTVLRERREDVKVLSVGHVRHMEVPA